MFRLVTVDGFHTSQNISIVEGKYHHLLLQDAERLANARAGRLGDVKPRVIVEHRPLRRRSYERGDVGPGRRPRHEFLQLLTFNSVAAGLWGRQEPAARRQYQTERKRSEEHTSELQSH